ncbi:glycogenin glucosyltransferase [Tieghemiomyces parasiticus]|uniref:glycogenin glucosyltransferase n=1 Tax=Tieghemiomyces parasiticus TaxID=78921 RepID=A0A9W8E297_9FUNG|nr:glycogenin glucosyltransferase [Tieghemiomyces parasiticus]
MAFAYVTLVTSDDYAAGALTLARSLRRTGTPHRLVCLVTLATVSTATYLALLAAFDSVTPVATRDSGDYANLTVLGRPDLGATWTKLELWRLTDYAKVIFLDADTLVLRNIDDLFDRTGDFAAAPDIGWPDCFNSGVMVCTPSHHTFDKLVAMASVGGSFDGGDQGLLNDYFADWATAGPAHRLAFTDNFTASAVYTYAPAFRRFGDRVRVVHFIGPNKPWRCDRYTDGQARLPPGGHPDWQPFYQTWWAYRDLNSDVPASTDGMPYAAHQYHGNTTGRPIGQGQSPFVQIDMPSEPTQPDAQARGPWQLADFNFDRVDHTISSAAGPHSSSSSPPDSQAQAPSPAALPCTSPVAYPQHYHAAPWVPDFDPTPIYAQPAGHHRPVSPPHVPIEQTPQVHAMDNAYQSRPWYVPTRHSPPPAPMPSAPQPHALYDNAYYTHHGDHSDHDYHHQHHHQVPIPSQSHHHHHHRAVHEALGSNDRYAWPEHRSEAPHRKASPPWHSSSMNHHHHRVHQHQQHPHEGSRHQQQPNGGHQHHANYSHRQHHHHLEADQRHSHPPQQQHHHQEHRSRREQHHHSRPGSHSYSSESGRRSPLHQWQQHVAAQPSAHRMDNAFTNSQKDARPLWFAVEPTSTAHPTGSIDPTVAAWPTPAGAQPIWAANRNPSARQDQQRQLGDVVHRWHSEITDRVLPGPGTLSKNGGVNVDAFRLDDHPLFCQDHPNAALNRQTLAEVQLRLSQIDSRLEAYKQPAALPLPFQHTLRIRTTLDDPSATDSAPPMEFESVVTFDSVLVPPVWLPESSQRLNNVHLVDPVSISTHHRASTSTSPVSVVSSSVTYPSTIESILPATIDDDTESPQPTSSVQTSSLDDFGGYRVDWDEHEMGWHVYNPLPMMLRKNLNERAERRRRESGASSMAVSPSEAGTPAPEKAPPTEEVVDGPVEDAGEVSGGDEDVQPKARALLDPESQRLANAVASDPFQLPPPLVSGLDDQESHSHRSTTLADVEPGWFAPLPTSVNHEGSTLAENPEAPLILEKSNPTPPNPTATSAPSVPTSPPAVLPLGKSPVSPADAPSIRSLVQGVTSSSGETSSSADSTSPCNRPTPKTND